MKDLCIERENASESLALIGEVLGAAGVNIYGLCLVTSEGRSVVHLAVEDSDSAEHALERAGIRVGEVSEVYVLSKDEKGVTGRPGSFGGICRLLTDNGIRIRFGYPAENNQFIFGVDDIEKVRELLE